MVQGIYPMQDAFNCEVQEEVSSQGHLSGPARQQRVLFGTTCIRHGRLEKEVVLKAAFEWEEPFLRWTDCFSVHCPRCLTV